MNYYLRKSLISIVIVLISLSSFYSFSQDNQINVYQYANMNSPDYKRNVGLWKQEQELLSKERYPSSQTLNSIQQIRDQYDKDWTSIGLSSIVVKDNNAKVKLEEAINAEIKRLNESIKQNAIAHKASLSNPQLYANSVYLAAFDENVKKSRLYETLKYIKIGKVNENNEQTNIDSNIEQEFLIEIAKINADIANINRLAQNRQIIESFGNAQKLCDKLRRLQGQQYFSSSLKKIRKQNPGFRFNITPLAEQVTREYWIGMRNRANLAYHNAMEAYKGCVYNEGIQQAQQVEIPIRFAKTTFDLFNSVGDLFSKKVFGTIQELYTGYVTKEGAMKMLKSVSDDHMAANEDGYDWKSYTGILGGLLSALDGYKKSFDMAKENYSQADLLVMNRQSADQLMKSNRNLLQEFDRYRAFVDANSSSVDCLNDRLMRLDLDNKSIKGDKITIWGTGLYDWDGEEFISQIKEVGEDLKNEYIYCEDFVKELQIILIHAQTDYGTIEEKVKNSGADPTQIEAQLSYNRENGEWFQTESTRLSEHYSQFCNNPENTYPKDIIVIGPTVLPGDKPDLNPVDDPVTKPDWTTNNSSEKEYSDPSNHLPNNNQTGMRINTKGIYISGTGWSAQKVKNEPEKLKEDITNAVNAGKTPAGISVSDYGEVELFYIDDNPLGMTSWNLEWYNDATTLSNGITNNLENGYFPMGISFADNGQLYVLYIQSQLHTNVWQLVESVLDLDMVSHDLQNWINQQYVPVGITVFSGKYYTLMAQLPNAQMTNWTIEGYEDNNHSLEQSVNTKINSGLVPFGYLKEQNIVNVLYVGF